MTTLALVAGTIMTFGGMGLVALALLMRPVDAEIARSKVSLATIVERTEATKKETAQIEQRTEETRQRTAEIVCETERTSKGIAP